MLNRMATDGLASQLSASWTYPIDSGTEQILQRKLPRKDSHFLTLPATATPGLRGISTPMR